MKLRILFGTMSDELVRCSFREFYRVFSIQDLVCFGTADERFPISFRISQQVLFVSISQLIVCKDRLHNDLDCVGWGIRHYSNSIVSYRCL